MTRKTYRAIGAPVALSAYTPATINVTAQATVTVAELRVNELPPGTPVLGDKLVYLGTDGNDSNVQGGTAITGSANTTQISGIGSPAYMSPQQVREQPLDHRTDIYSLGVVMYQLLCGQLPFQASTNYNIIYQIINSEPKPPSALRKKIPEVLDEIVAKAMSKDAADRYQTWGEFAHDLAQAFRKTHPALKSVVPTLASLLAFRKD